MSALPHDEVAADLRLEAMQLTPTADEVAAFARVVANGAHAPDHLPPTYPVCLVTRSPLGDELKARLSAEAAILIQRSQSFSYRAPLPLPQPITCGLSVRRGRAADTTPITVEIALNGTGGSALGACRSDIVALRPEVPLRLPEPASYARYAREAEVVAAHDFGSSSLADFSAYAAVSGDDNPIHVDPDAARSAGLAAPIAPGMLVMARMLSVALEAVAGHFASAGQVVFTAPLPKGARLICECWQPAAQNGARNALRLKLVAHDGADRIVALGACTLAPVML